ncbi:MAG TPA: ATP-binding cassette domain-containing protein [Leucothrix mucor]|nr:ATP-binding cassette domain-containing protein [Leucothrix mucor]
MALLQLINIQLSFGGPALLDNVNLTIEPRERVCLIGRNGAGKSTLMKVINGQIKADSGEKIVDGGVIITQLEQEVPHDVSGTVYDVVASGLKEVGDLLTQYHHLNERDDIGSDDWMTVMGRLQEKLEANNGWHFQVSIDKVISLLKLDPDADFAKLSGGIKRRVLLARALVQEPDILLLDEPTNHLDINAILWLEDFLKTNYKGSVIFITHDRAFLRSLATRIIELDRGQATSWPGDYDNFLRRKEEVLHAEDLENKRFDKKLAQEEVWIRQGIKARRTRNEGRVRSLEKMRKERSQRRNQQGNATLRVDSGERTGKRVVEVENLRYTLPNGRVLIDDLSLLVQRGDKIGLIGPNGVGKSTLLRVLLGETKPDSGKMIEGTNLQVAYFDQLRSQLDETKTVKDNLDNGADRITIKGESKHVISYLQDFLFTPDRVNSPVKSLSGGERNRLLLAKLFIKPANVLVLDEPTNDLDVETLELLEELLLNYTGTVLIVSHDRAFINNIVSSCLVFKGNGEIDEFLGSYDEWQALNPSSGLADESNKGLIKDAKKSASATTTETSEAVTTATASKEKKLSYNDKRELETLPKEIETLENDIETLQEKMVDADFFTQDHKKVTETTERLQQLEASLAEKYERWESLDA